MGRTFHQDAPESSLWVRASFYRAGVEENLLPRGPLYVCIKTTGALLKYSRINLFLPRHRDRSRRLTVSPPSRPGVPCQLRGRCRQVPTRFQSHPLVNLPLGPPRVPAVQGSAGDEARQFGGDVRITALHHLVDPIWPYHRDVLMAPLDRMRQCGGFGPHHISQSAENIAHVDLHYSFGSVDVRHSVSSCHRVGSPDRWLRVSHVPHQASSRVQVQAQRHQRMYSCFSSPH